MSDEPVRDPQPLHRVLDAFARDFEGPTTSTISAIVTHWSDIVGAELATASAPGSLTDGVLTVVVDDPAAATALRQRAAAVADRLGTWCGPGVVRSLQTRVRRR